MKLSFQNYRQACGELFTANMHNPALYWNGEDGFYVSSNLIPNDDLSLGQAFYSANTGERSHAGTRGEYQPLARAIRAYHATRPNETLQRYVDYAAGMSR